MLQLCFLNIFLILCLSVGKVPAKDPEAAKQCIRVMELGELTKKCCLSIINLDEKTLAHSYDTKTVCEQLEELANSRGRMINQEINYEEMGALLDRFTTNNPDMKTAIEKAKSVCFNDKFKDYFPDDVCKAVKFATCQHTVLLVNCPKFNDDPECDELKTAIERCRKLYN